MKALVKKTLAYLAARTCLTFVENATATNRIRVFPGSGCYSSIGMIGGEQDLSLADGCDTMGIIAHEFMHALGIFHMQSRFDRDSFITIDLTNVPALRGVDPEQRRERLRNLRLVDMVTSPASTSTNTDDNQSIKANLAFFSGGGPILEQNGIEGVIDYLYEGDINLTEEQLAALESKLNNGTTRQKRQASKVASLWANKKVFYYFDASLGEPMKALVKKTLAYLTARTCLTFVENATATNRIRVFNGSGCYSSIGMIGGEQDLSLGDGCGITLRAEDPEQRRERLRNLQAVDVVTSPPGVSSNTDENDLIETSMASLLGGGSIVEKNRIAGGTARCPRSEIEQMHNSPKAPRPILYGQTKKSSTTLMQASVGDNGKQSKGEPKKALVKKTLAYLTARTCITFVENATAMHRIRVVSGEGRNSFVGMVGGEQDLSLGEGCDTMGIVAHEFIHAHGVYHMQSRHDRDSFITVDLTNVPVGIF
ncbi:unnamed protein product [Haemonchus placei]|uniref:Metalloendopeptidase n=1 Tax=Haemonchus placei TaxID=6290 RepID=A0A0N4VSJ2_HAEPC|nr:unnamed protein product [Haemonchus placei]